MFNETLSETRRRKSHNISALPGENLRKWALTLRHRCKICGSLRKTIQKAVQSAKFNENCAGQEAIRSSTREMIISAHFPAEATLTAAL